MKRALIVLAFVTVFGAGWFARSLAPPTYPSSWDSLEIGFTEAEAKAAIPNLDSGMRGLKGFDQAGVDYGDRYWRLLVSYDNSGRVSEITKNYVNRDLGIFNRSLREPR